MIGKKGFAAVLFIVFFLCGLFTLPHYGTNWDTVNHLPRGQAYLNYLIGGHRDFSNLSKRTVYSQNPDSLGIDSDVSMSMVSSRSIYQSDATTFDWFMLHDGNGHPPASDILSSVFNRVLFGKLRLINDIDSYRVYGILLSALLVSLVFLWVSEQYGFFGGFVASLSLMLYPLFWAESHFNTEKDVPETAFWSFMLYCVWRGTTQKKWRWLILAGVFFGLALGTKLNIVFSIFVIVPWLIYYIIIVLAPTRLHPFTFIKKNLFYLLTFLFFPLLGATIFIVLWPYLWVDPIGRIVSFLRFYKDIGLTSNTTQGFVGPLGTNLYPLKWIVYTTPIESLVLGAIGIVFVVLRKRSDKTGLGVFLLLWLVVPIFRISLPGTNVYGGVRQIMEYIPALCMLAGVGSYYLISLIKRYTVFFIFPAYIIILSGFIFVLSLFVKMHPNENVYFNFLIGGLSGAKETNMPSWGNTFGGAYRQGVSFIDKNAEKNANVVLAYELLPNIPNLFFRSDLTFQNRKRSGYLRLGEWAITLVYQGTYNRSYYDTYLEKFIKPSFVASVDGVAVLKVWKNSPENLIKPWKEAEVAKFSIKKIDDGLEVLFPLAVSLSRIEISYNQNNCPDLKSGIVKITSDGKNWKEMPGVLPDFWRISSLGKQPSDGSFIEPFNGEETSEVRLILKPRDTCLTHYNRVKVFRFLN